MDKLKMMMIIIIILVKELFNLQFTSSVNFLNRCYQIVN